MKKLLALLLAALLIAGFTLGAFAEDEPKPIELPKVVSAGIIEDRIREMYPDDEETANQVIFMTETLVPFSTTTDMVSELFDPNSEMSSYHPVHQGAKIIASAASELLPPGVSTITNKIAQTVIDGVSDTFEFIGNEIEEKGLGGFAEEMVDATEVLVENPEIISTILKEGFKAFTDFITHLFW